MVRFSLRRKPGPDTSALGADLVALRLDAGDMAPAPCVVVVFGAAGQARRTAPGKVACGPGEAVFCFHPGPYTVDVIPFAAAPEWGLRLRFLVDANPRVAQQRFDLFLFSETSGRLSLAGFGASVQAALQAELAQGALDLPPCTSLEEWHAFRAGLNQLLYTRYGVTVDDCVPVDLGGHVDFADILRARAARASAGDAASAAAPVHTLSATPVTPVTAAAAGAQAEAQAEAKPGDKVGAHAGGPTGAPTSGPADGRHDGQRDAFHLRRLFLELPVLTRDLRLLTVPAVQFQPHQSLLLRLGMADLDVTTMPSLAWAAPDRPLDAASQARRARASAVAVAALDEAWSLLARLQPADEGHWPELMEEADRICANLEAGRALRRAPQAPPAEPTP
ncbi:MAG: hypothetical protein ABW069_08485 [Duganella sp.]